MGTRVSLLKLAVLIRAAKVANPAVVISFAADALAGVKALKFLGTVTVGGVVYDLAGNNGKRKIFSDADDFVKFVATASPIGSGAYPVTLNTGDVLAAAVPSDMVAYNAARVVKLNAMRVSQLAVKADVQTQIDLMTADGWATGSSLQVAKLAEVTLQAATIQLDVDAIDAEIVRLTP
jgi:hypothetical protein